MNDIEKQLFEERKRINSIETPDELETNLREALRNAPVKRKKKAAFIWKIVVAAMLLFSLIGYNYNALAYYSKKILGFDNMLFSTLRDLNDNDMGQGIDKSIQLENETTFTVNGIMTDENQLLLFYTLHNPNGLESNDDFISPSTIKGFLTNSSTSGGSGSFNADGTELKGMYHFDPINPFAKELTLVIWQYTEDGEFMKEITFPHDPNKAMQASIKQNINETFAVDQGEITFETIQVTPTLIVVEGSLQIDNYDRFEFPFNEIKLVVNERTMTSKSGGSRTSSTGTTFDLRYNAISEELQALQIEMRKFTGYEEISKSFSLDSILNEFITIHEEEELIVKEVAETARGTEITIATDENVTLDGVLLETEDGAIPLETTIKKDIKMQKDGRYMKQRTLVFPTSAPAESIFIEGIHYLKKYNKVIDIPLD